MTKYGIMIVGRKNYADDYYIGMFCFPDSGDKHPIMFDTHEGAMIKALARAQSYPGYIFEPRLITSRICKALRKSHMHKFSI